MKFPTKLILALSLALASPAYADELPSAEAVEVGKTLDFVADISKYQGMFESVVEFCRPHAPARILERAQLAWHSKNQRYLDIRDRELARVIGTARENGATPEKISLIENWARQQYESALSNNRMYKDLLALKDLPVACSKRLGEMNSSGMDLQVLRPTAAEYAKSVGEP